MAQNANSRVFGVRRGRDVLRFGLDVELLRGKAKGQVPFLESLWSIPSWDAEARGCIRAALSGV